MSVRIMTQVWDLDLPDSQKIVMLALADCANDEGLAWPSIATMARKCSKSPRTIQSMIRKLEEDGLVTRIEVAGRGNKYHLHPCKVCTPAKYAPPQGTTKTPAKFAPAPAAAAPKPSLNLQEPSGGAREARAATPDFDQSSDGWSPPPVADLPDMTRAMVEQWPAGAYELVCERFRLYWPAPKRTPARLAKWLLDDHGKVMRDARAGVSFEALAPSAAGKRATAAPPVDAQDNEGHAPRARREALRAIMPAETYDRFIAPAALLQNGEKWMLIVGSEFQRAWIEQNLMDGIKAALRNPVNIAVECRDAGRDRLRSGQ